MVKLLEDSADRIEFHDDSGQFVRLIRWFLIFCVATVGMVALFNGSFGSVLLVLVVAALFWKLADYANVTSDVRLDRPSGQVTIVQKRGGKVLQELTRPLTEIDNVIVQSSSRSGASDETLQTRPAFIIAGDTVPLTFASFVSGGEPERVAVALRRFLGLPQDRLLEDSIDQAVREPAGTGPAVRLARLGLGMNRLDAAAYVQRLEQDPGG